MSHLSQNLDRCRPSCMLSTDEARSRKRPFSELKDDSFLDPPAVSAKRLKLRSNPSLEPGHHYQGGDFWHTLSQVHLTRGALREHVQNTQRLHKQSSPKGNGKTQQGFAVQPSSIKRFARGGGPDLTDLRGVCIMPQSSLLPNFANLLVSKVSTRRTSSAMNPPPVSLKRRSKSTKSGSHVSKTSNVSAQTSQTSTSDRSSSYSRNFGQKLVDSSVYPARHTFADGTGHPEPENPAEIKERLRNRRASLSPSRFTEEHFRNFERENDRANSESLVIHNVVPFIAGSTDQRFYTEMNRKFTNLEPFDSTLSAPTPDLYDGILPESIPSLVRDELDKYIIPCTDTSLPAAPNFFAEFKSHSGRPDVAQSQACYDGAVGARAMHKLLNYSNSEEQYDNKARSFSAIYHPGTSTLAVYGSHMTAPETPDGKPRIHMKHIYSFAMNNDLEVCARSNRISASTRAG